MISATKLRAGTTFYHEDKPYFVQKYQIIKMGRGGATVRVNVRNLETGSIRDLSFSSNLSFDDVSLKKKRLQYLYKDGTEAVFMDPINYEQVEIPEKVLGDDLLYIKEGEEVDVQYLEDKPISCDIPPKVTLRVEKTDPGVKGNSATNMYKPATLENGLKLKVPLFIKTGDEIRVDTRSGEYVERAK